MVTISSEAKGKDGPLPRPVIDAVAGALAGGVARFFVSPLDVLKIRFQVQLEPVSAWQKGAAAARSAGALSVSKYTGLLQAAKDMVREEGLGSLWSGMVPAQMLVMPYCAIQFAVIHKFKSLVAGSSKGEDHRHLSPAMSFLGGSLAGCAATVGSYPFDLLRTILASQGEPKVYPHMRAAMVGIVKTRGVAGLYAGLSPTIVEIIPYAGLQFGFYDLFNKWALARRRKLVGTVGPPEALTLTSFEQFTSGLVAGTLAKVICHPLDVVKKRFQVGGLARHVRYGARVDPQTYKNMLDALQQIAAKEGMHGLYKGVLPSVIKAAPAAAITFFLYELISKHLESVVT